MSIAAGYAGAREASYWPVPLARAVPAIAVGLVITFSADHTSQLGLIAFGAFAVLTGIVLAWSALRLTDPVLRGVFFAHAVLAVLAGVAALIFHSGGLGFLLFLITAFFASTGFLELYAALRSRGRNASSRDWLIIGGFTAIAALVFLLIPLGPVEAVGLFGTYGILVGLFLVIAGLSLKWAKSDAVEAVATVEEADDTVTTMNETEESASR